MDELLIDDKKYVSSKQAAKMTGYAKDYIGQLCREGRVPARLVGRSWYVLETAIQDHRFGNTDIQPEEVKGPTPVLPAPKWESPRYEASSDELLPSVNRLRNSETDKTEPGPEELVTPEGLQDSWRAWFDRVVDSEVAAPVVEPAVETNKIEEKPEESDSEPMNVPIHTIYELPPEDLLPRHVVEVQTQREQELPERQERQKGRSIGMVRAIQVCGIVLALVTATFAIAGSGYLDKYISNSQVRIIAGVALYNK